MEEAEKAKREWDKIQIINRDASLAMQLKDEELARQLQKEMENSQREEQDRELARKMNEERERDMQNQDALLAQRLHREMGDAEVARKVQAEWEREEKRLIEEKRRMEEERSRQEAERKRIEEERRAAEEIQKNLPKIDVDVKRYIGDFTQLNTLLKTYIGCEMRRVIKPELQQRFETTWVKYQQKYGKGSIQATPRIAFHGTKSARMASIEQNGLLVPGSAGVTHATDSGWYGRGIYLSPTASYSMAYSDDGRLIVCAVLMGKVFRCMSRLDGAGLQPNSDSHESPDGQEYVMFDAGQVLPLFVINTRNIKIVHSAKNAIGSFFGF